MHKDKSFKYKIQKQFLGESFYRRKLRSVKNDHNGSTAENDAHADFCFVKGF